MRAVFLQSLEVIERAFRRLERQVHPPVEQPRKDGFVLRYQERTIEQALIQKLARQVSGLHAIDALLLKGLAQEQVPPGAARRRCLELLLPRPPERHDGGEGLRRRLPCRRHVCLPA